MSLKYQRIRQSDEQLPWLLKQLTRAFSSITLAVLLLLLIVCYGVIGSVPVGMLAVAVMMFFAVALPMGIGIVGTWQMGWTRKGMGVLLILLAISIAVMDMYAVQRFTQSVEWFARYHTSVIYRLRYFEMTELELYSWWPMKLLLGLFVLNMIWATIRRIEFKFMNLGVLSVHTGIVILAIGSMFYGNAKQEGDTILWRADQPMAKPVNTFYDAVTPALYFSVGKAEVMIPLPQLPRYNDYDPQTHALDIRLHETPGFTQRFGNQLKATIPGFLAYANLQSAWLNDPLSEPNPAWQVQLLAGEKGPQISTHTLVGQSSLDNRLEGGSWAVQYLIAPTAAQLQTLKAPQTQSSKPVSRFYLIQTDANKPALQLLICLPGHEALQVPLTEDRFPLASFADHSLWLQIMRYMPNARQSFIPVPVPHNKRVSKEEGTYLNALLPVDMQMPLPDGSTWERRIWLSHMRYPDPGIANDQNRPVRVNIPTIGPVDLCFSRQRIELPFTLKLNDFAMLPYPGSDMPRDFYSNITLTPTAGKPIAGITRLNHPIVHSRIKISQTGWDPGDPQNPDNNEKDQQGNFKHQQRYVILGIGNNVGIHIIFTGACLIVLGIPWAFYIKPVLVRLQKHQIQRTMQNAPVTEES